ncbi:LuxR C-terminal-related transcriptional regulator [Glycomyces tarimensis]
MDTSPHRLEKSFLAEEETLIIDMLYDGLTQKAIGRKLGVNDRTVRRRLDELKIKLGAANSLQIPLNAHNQKVWSPPCCRRTSISRPRRNRSTETTDCAHQ